MDRYSDSSDSSQSSSPNGAPHGEQIGKSRVRRRVICPQCDAEEKELTLRVDGLRKHYQKKHHGLPVPKANACRTAPERGQQTLFQATAGAKARSSRPATNRTPQEAAGPAAVAAAPAHTGLAAPPAAAADRTRGPATGPAAPAHNAPAAPPAAANVSNQFPESIAALVSQLQHEGHGIDERAKYSLEMLGRAIATTLAEYGVATKKDIEDIMGAIDEQNTHQPSPQHQQQAQSRSRIRRDAAIDDLMDEFGFERGENADGEA